MSESPNLRNEKGSKRQDGVTAAELAQLRTIAAALVSEAPSPPTVFDEDSDSSIDISHLQPARPMQDESRWRSLRPLTLAAAAAMILLAGLLALGSRNGQDTIATPTIASEIGESTPAEPERIEPGDDERLDDEAAPVLLAPLPSPPADFEPPTEAELADALDLGAAPIGANLSVVARDDGGVPLADSRQREIFVYDEPFGEPRRLGPFHERRLLHPGADGAPLVLPVHAGNSADTWLQVQVPSNGPEPEIAWVEAADFEVVMTDRTAIFTVLADGAARMQVVRSGDLLFDEPLSYAPGASASPFASSGWVHNTLTGGVGTWLDLNLARTDLSSLALGPGLSIRADPSMDGPQIAVMEEAALERLAVLVTPGTRVVTVNRLEAAGPERFDRPEAKLTTTVPLDTPLLGSQRARVPGQQPLWTYCDEAWCRSVDSTVESDSLAEPAPIGSFFLVARADGGVPYSPIADRPDPTDDGPTLQAPPNVPFVSVAPPDKARVVEVFDRPNGEPRMLVYRNDVDRTEAAYPLMTRSVFEQPLVLRLVRGLPGDQWFEVQAPTRPTRRTVFVRAADFSFASTTTSVEIDARVGGGLTLFDAAEPVLRSSVVSARESRPHTFHDTLIDQVFSAENLGPAYGNWIASHNTWSEALGTFGGGGLPGQTLHGTNQPDLMDQAVSSGGVRVSNEIMAELVTAEGTIEPWAAADRSSLLGASIVIYDGSSLANALEVLTVESWEPAETVQFDPEAVPAVPVPSYS